MKYPLNEIYDWPILPKAVVIILFCFIILYFGYFLSFSDQISKLNRLERQEQDLKTQYSAVASDVNTLLKELAAYPLLINALNVAQNKIISPKELPEVLNDILRISRQNELEINQFNPQPEVKSNAYTKVTIKALMTGTYDQIANFVSQIANMDKTIAISNFILSKPKPATTVQPTVSNGRLDAELMLDVYEVKKP